MLTVLDIRDSPWVDGPGRTILETAKALEKMQIRVLIGTFSGGKKENPYLNKARDLGLDIVIIEDRSSLDPGVLGRIKDIIRKHNVDVIHTHEFRSNIFGLLAGGICRIPVISTTHGWIVNSRKDQFYTLLDKLLLRFFDRIITVSRRQANDLRRKFRIDRAKLTIIHNTLRVENYFVKKNNNFKKQLGLASEDLLIANIGRLSPEKGQTLFLRCAAELIRRYKYVYFVLIGIGPDKERLETMTEELGIQQYVKFAGYREDMIDIYNGIDLVVQSSYTEGMPNVVLESLLMEVPVIATDVGGTSEIVEHRINGILVQAGDQEGIVNNIVNFIERHGDFALMARRGREKIITHFNSEVRIKKMNALYLEVSGKG